MYTQFYTRSTGKKADGEDVATHSSYAGGTWAPESVAFLAGETWPSEWLSVACQQETPSRLWSDIWSVCKQQQPLIIAVNSKHRERQALQNKWMGYSHAQVEWLVISSQNMK